MPSATPTRTTPRRRARELVLQGLYQRQLAGNDLDDIRAQLVDDAGYARADHVFFGELWNGVLTQFIAASARFNANELYAFVFDKFVEDSNCV